MSRKLLCFVITEYKRTERQATKILNHYLQNSSLNYCRINKYYGMVHQQFAALICFNLYFFCWLK